jgi:hypothetical protein
MWVLATPLYEARSVINIISSISPKINDQMECINAVLEQYLNTYESHQQDDKVLWLPLAKFAINYHKLETTGITHFYANNGCHPCSNLHLTEQHNIIENLNC